MKTFISYIISFKKNGIALWVIILGVISIKKWESKKRSENKEEKEEGGRGGEGSGVRHFTKVSNLFYVVIEPVRQEKSWVFCKLHYLLCI